MELKDGDIVFIREFDHPESPIYDYGMIVKEDGVPYVMKFRPFLGRVKESLPDGVCCLFYRYVGRRDNQKSDFDVSADAAKWFKRWNKYRFSTYFWIFLSRLPLFKNWVKGTEDTAKAIADKGFITSTAIAWAYECAGVDLVPNRSPDLTSVGDLMRCPLFRKVT